MFVGGQTIEPQRIPDFYGDLRLDDNNGGHREMVRLLLFVNTVNLTNSSHPLALNVNNRVSP